MHGHVGSSAQSPSTSSSNGKSVEPTKRDSAKCPRWASQTWSPSLEGLPQHAQRLPKGRSAQLQRPPQLKPQETYDQNCTPDSFHTELSIKVTCSFCATPSVCLHFVLSPVQCLRCRCDSETINLTKKKKKTRRKKRKSDKNDFDLLASCSLMFCSISF